MVLPGAVAVATPIIVGILLGHEAVAGMLMVGTIAGVLLATVLNNGGGAWDNAKKYIESGNLKDAEGKDRKSTRLNSSHANISYAVFCLKKKKNKNVYKYNVVQLK